MIRGQEVIRGFIPARNYTVRFSQPEVKTSGSGFEMVVFQCEIIAPDKVEAAGRVYGTAGAKGSCYIMLNNKNGVDSALSQLSQPLDRLGLLDNIPAGAEYGVNDVKAALANLDGKNVSMLVECETVYVTESKGKGDDRDPSKAVKDDETGEPIVKSYQTRFDFRHVKALVASPSDF